MAKSTRPWTVTPHGPIEELDENLWAVESRVPGVPIRRRMLIIKRSEGTLAFFHAIPVDEATLARITAWGKPAILVIGHDQHGIDATPFAGKLGLRIYGPKANEAKLRAKFDLAGTLEDIPPDPAVSFEAMQGTKMGDAVGVVRTNGRVSLLFTDVYQDNGQEKLPLPLRILGFGVGPKVPPVFKFLFVRDRAAVRKQLEGFAALPGLARLVPCHGRVESADAAGALKTAIAGI